MILLLEDGEHKAGKFSCSQGDKRGEKDHADKSSDHQPAIAEP
jgi:hypothetical protein